MIPPQGLVGFEALVAAHADAGQRERRERIATAVLAGMVGNPVGLERMPERAVMLADALMAELDKEAR